MKRKFSRNSTSAKRRTVRNGTPADGTFARLSAGLRVPESDLVSQYQDLAGARVGTTTEVGPVTMEVTPRGIMISFRPPGSLTRVRIPLPLPRNLGTGGLETDNTQPRTERLSNPTFADKVETLAALIIADKRATILAHASTRLTPEQIKYSLDSIRIEVEPSRKYWYIRFGGSRFYAIDVATGIVNPMNSKGVQEWANVRIDEIGNYDWGTRRYSPPKRVSPIVPAWVRSPHKSPSTGPKRERTVPLRTADAVDDYVSWTPKREISSGHIPDGSRGSQYSGWRGSKQGTCGRSGQEIAKCVRKDIEAAEKRGDLPRGIETSVRSDHNHIRVEVTRLPRVLVVNPEFALAAHADPSFTGENRGHDRVPRYTPAGEAVLAQLRGIVNAYNRDNSDTMTDYFDVEFYEHVDFDDRLLSQQTSDILSKRGLKERRDAYLTADLREAVDAKWDSGPVVYYGASGMHVQWVDRWNKVLAEAAVSSPAEALEMAQTWKNEFSRKAQKNGRGGAKRKRCSASVLRLSDVS